MNPRIHTGSVYLPTKLARVAEGLKAFMAGTAALCVSEDIEKSQAHRSQPNDREPAPVLDGDSRFRASNHLGALVSDDLSEMLKRNQKTNPLRLPFKEEILMRITR